MGTASKSAWVRAMWTLFFIAPSLMLVLAQSQSIFLFHAMLFPEFASFGWVTCAAFESVYIVLSLASALFGAALNKKATRTILAAEFVAVIFSGLASADVTGLANPIGTAIMALLPFLNLMFLQGVLYITQSLTEQVERQEKRSAGKTAVEVDRMVKVAVEEAVFRSSQPLLDQIDNLTMANRNLMDSMRTSRQQTRQYKLRTTKRTPPVSGRGRGRPRKNEIIVLPTAQER